MKLKEFINEYKAYQKAEQEITKWVEETYPGLSMDYSGTTAEVVQIDENANYPAEQVPKIVEVINLKIDEILEKHEEEIYIAEKLTLIWRRHPMFNPEIESIEELKKNQKFLKYFKELKFYPNKKQKGGLNGKRKRQIFNSFQFRKRAPF